MATIPLQLIVTKYSALIISLCDISVLREGQCVTSTTSKLAGRSGVQWTAITDGIGDIVRYFCVFDPDVQLTSKHTGCQQHTRCNHSQYCTGGEHGAGFSALEFGSFQRTGSYHFWCGYLFSGTNDYHTI